ncbi:DNA double-strand break repair nuclease NurA [Candidatus Methylacidiphilum infernorum]|uniref:NurA nuclease n=1 Tax=Methylacidiphilum infernorum (isolate V4) TaxID=481448 RepID=B3E1B0_METI4|nr:DNA double-strand break repair nuclease NurA [Candidatus Methylacidiphilum infernorum]ACD82906.1 NurA nuclease [Methylacidiphilum infernorum V4]
MYKAERMDQSPFAELPAALVEEMLSKSETIGDRLYDSFKEIRNRKLDYRQQLQNRNFLKLETEVGYPGIPTTCGIDGSYGVEKLLAADFAACAAVAVEGLIPPSEKKYWEKPHHRVFIHPEKHDPDTGVMIRSVMMEMEVELAAKAPHDVVFLDGSLTTPLIYLNQAVNRLFELEDKESETGAKLIEKFEGFLKDYKTILESSRTDKLWVSLPKYTSRRELGKIFNWPSHYDDRAMLTHVLSPGEFTVPVQLEKPKQPWHLKTPNNDGKLEKLKDEVISAVQRIHVMYYKPHPWTPVFRIEMSSSIATNSSRIAVLLQAIKFQSGTPGIIEPYPIYIADRIVKHLGKAIPAFRQIASRRMVELHDGDIGDIVFTMHGYRTESEK